VPIAVPDAAEVVEPPEEAGAGVAAALCVAELPAAG
jgi:hypothetical protein